jgi:cytochrome c-type biogenesis protein
VLAGLVSFLSPCMLPLVPGYLSYLAGLSGTGNIPPAPAAGPAAERWRVLAGGLLFVGGFTAVFVSYGALFGGLGGQLARYQTGIERVLGGVTIVLGLAFLGLVPALQRQWRPRWLPATGLAGAPLLGVAFGVGWTPCVGPTLGAVQTLAFDSASAARGAALSAAYCLGLGLPLLAAGVGFDRDLGRSTRLRRAAPWAARLGGGMLIAVGLLLATGWWDHLMIELRVWVSGFGTVI